MAIDEREKDRRLIRLSEEGGFWSQDYASLPQAKRVCVVIWELEAQVNNGGFHQYFWNYSGRLASEAVDALLAIGAPAMAAIVRDAITVVGGGLPWRDADARQAHMDALAPAAIQQLENT
jgi:hypothetical protein